MKRIELQRRVHLNVLALDKFKTDHIAIELRMPLRSETAALYALIPKVLARGTRAYPDLTALSRRFEELYGSGIWATSYKSGEGLTVSLGSYPLNSQYAMDDMDILGETVNLMGQMLFDPILEEGCFLAEYVENEKISLMEAIRAEINEKGRYALRQAIRHMCKGEAFAVDGSGTVEQVQQITPQALTEAWRQMLKKAKIEIWAIGRIDEESLIEALQPILNALPEGDSESAETLVKRQAEGEVKVIDEVQPMKQGNLVMGFRSGTVLADGEEAYTPFLVFLSVYGSGTTSKLFMNVREKLSLCYYCMAGADPLKGIMYVQSGIDPANLDAARNEILAQLEAVRNGDITDEELENAKIGLVNRYREMSDESGYLRSWYANRLLSGRFDSPDDAARAVMAVTKDQVVAAAKGVSADTFYFLHSEAGEEHESEEEMA